MRRKSNLDARFQKCRHLLISDYANYRGRWLSAFDFRELRVELGCGKGRFINETARMHPDILFVAIEKTDNVLITALEHTERAGISNIRYICTYADDLINIFAAGEVSKIYINFCDPWPSNKYIKRRLTSDFYLPLYKNVLSPGGEIELKTDNLPLFRFSVKQFKKHKYIICREINNLYHSSPGGVMTDYELKFYSLGIPVHYINVRTGEEISEIIMPDMPDFDLVKIFQCGQCFRWYPDPGYTQNILSSGSIITKTFNADSPGKQVRYTGIAYNRPLAIRQSGKEIIFETTKQDFNDIWYDYFDLSRDYIKIRNRLNTPAFMSDAVKYGIGLRILKQEPWEALVSFIISQRNNIPRIKKIISTLCRLYGEPVSFGSDSLHSFPAAEKIAALSESDLAPLHCGYRTRYLLSAAGAIASKAVDFEVLKELPLPQAREVLKTLPGVGDKVADCVLLFGMHKFDAFPVDVWISRALKEHFLPGFNPQIYAPYRGVAQQYLFYYMKSRQ